MKSEGNTGTYVGGEQGRPLPRFGEKVTHIQQRAKPTGLDWSKHRAPDASPVVEEPANRRCRGCGNPTPVDELRDRQCPVCADHAEERFHAPDAALHVVPSNPQEEPCPTSQSPAAAASAAAPTKTPVTTPSPEPAPGSSPTSAPPASDHPALDRLLVELQAHRHQLAAELKRVDLILEGLAAAETTTPPTVAAHPTPTPAGRPAATTRRPRATYDVEDVVRRYQAGETCTQLAASTGTSPSRIRQVLDKAGVQRRDDRAAHSGGHPKRPDEDDPAVVAEVRRLYLEDGLNQAAVAAKFGHTASWAQGLMARHNIPVRPPASVRQTELVDDEETIAAVRRLYLDGRSQSAIAAEYGVSQTHVSRFMRRHGIATRSTNFARGGP